MKVPSVVARLGDGHAVFGVGVLAWEPELYTLCRLEDLKLGQSALCHPRRIPRMRY
jgi:hypothetical protein